MALTVGRSVIAGDGCVGSGSDPGRAGATTAALPLWLAQRLPLSQPLRLLHRVRIVDGTGLHPTVLPQPAEREECYVSGVLHRCAWPTVLCSLCSIVVTNSLYVYGSVHRWSTSIIVQRDATLSTLFIILQVHSTCFGCQPHPSSGVHKTVTTASSTGHIFCAATSLQRDQASLATLEGGSCTVPEAVVTVLCTPDEGCGWHPKHVKWTCRIINRLLSVASRWTIIDIHLAQYYILPLRTIIMLTSSRGRYSNFKTCEYIIDYISSIHCVLHFAVWFEVPGGWCLQTCCTHCNSISYKMYWFLQLNEQYKLVIYGYWISSISVHYKNISVDVADQQKQTGKMLYVYHVLCIATRIGRCGDHHEGVLFYFYVCYRVFNICIQHRKHTQFDCFHNLMCAYF